MKVLQILPALETGGVERGTVEIAKALAKKAKLLILDDFAEARLSNVIETLSQSLRKSLPATTFCQFPILRSSDALPRDRSL